MAIAFPTTASDITTASWTTGTTTGAMAKPANVVDGDLLYAIVYDQVAASSVTGPSGWTAQYHAVATSTRGFYLFTKPIPSAAGETATTYTFTTSTSGRGVAILGRATGVNLTTPIDAAPTSDAYNSGASTTITDPAVTALSATAGCLALNFANGTTNVTHTFDASAGGFTAIANVNTNNAGSTSSIGVNARTVSGAGSTGAVVTTLSASAASSGGFLITFNPVLVSGGNASITLTATGGGAARATATATITLSAVQGTNLLSQWTAVRPFFISHRGGDADWPEDTAFAYANSAAWNSKMWLEVSVWPTSDGFWMLNDAATTGAAWNSNLTIASSTKATLQGLRSLADATKPPMFFDDFGAIYGPNGTTPRGIFLDNKANATNSTLKALAESYGWGPTTLVAKSFGPTSSTWISSMSAAGYSTWGYFYDTDVPTNLATYQANYTYLGLEKAATSGHWTTALSYGKLVIAHTIASATDKTNVLALGANGMMVSGVQEVVPTDATAGSGGATITLTATGTALPVGGRSGSATVTLTAAGAARAVIAAGTARITLTGADVPAPALYYLYTPPTWRMPARILGRPMGGITTGTIVYRQGGVWFNIMDSGMDLPVIANVDVDPTSGLLLFFARPTVVPSSLVPALSALTPADPSWTPGSLVLQ